MLKFALSLLDKEIHEATTNSSAQSLVNSLQPTIAELQELSNSLQQNPSLFLAQAVVNTFNVGTVIPGGAHICEKNCKFDNVDSSSLFSPSSCKWPGCAINSISIPCHYCKILNAVHIECQRVDLLTYYGVNHASGPELAGCPDCIINKLYENPKILMSLKELKLNANKHATSYCAYSGRCDQFVNPPPSVERFGQSRGAKCETKNCEMYISEKCKSQFQKHYCCYCIIPQCPDVNLRNWYFGITKTQRNTDNKKANNLVTPPNQSKEQQVKNRTQTYCDPTTGICHVSNSPGGKKNVLLLINSMSKCSIQNFVVSWKGKEKVMLMMKS